MDDNMTKLPGLPKGFRWVREPELRVITPVGWRIEKVVRKRIPRAVGAPVKRDGGWLTRYHEYLKTLKEGGEVGRFYPWEGGQVPPRGIQDVLLGDKRWVWLPTYGGVIRLADGPSDVFERSPADFKAGEFYLSGARCRIPGFATAQHDMWPDRVVVRLPDGIQSIADRAGVEGGGE